ncbi:phosphate acetyltransferase [Arachnia propionica]|uniref:Phosphate acetyltransferase n=1 Tax=Arachnia propionica TaxID=1750 RepID=A0A3P1WSL9_9ACTN|nr:phosphate acetyltransferase [Arachnia propionica]RRD49619.1 phosphate acetyltransferase [Arachnia propionica]
MGVRVHVIPASPSGDCAAAIRVLTQVLPDATVLDLGCVFSGGAVDVVRDPSEALGQALDMVESLDGDVITHVSFPVALEPVALELGAQLAATLGAGVLLAQDWEDSALAEVATAVVTARGARLVARFDGQSLRLPETPDLPGQGNLTVGRMLRELTAGSRPVVPADREDLLLGLLIGLATGQFPLPASVLVDGTPREGLEQLWRSTLPDVPLRRRGDVSAPPPTKAQFLACLERGPEQQTLSPLLFQRQLLRDARAADAHIVLPEGTEPRILRAAAELVRDGAVRLTLLGPEPEVRQLAAAEGLDLGDAAVVDPLTHEWRDRFADEYAELRAKKGVTRDQAFERMADVSYFGTMMVRAGFADGMVSGAVHTTAHTIRPAFEVIRTRPGVKVVSSAFFMCLADRVLVFGDCAVNPNPGPAELADIAAASAVTARSFGIEPRVALLSYSTGTSGSGPDVDAVAEATELLRSAVPDLACDGPLQFDAAVDPTVARGKAPDSPVAGRATVLIFPDLASGNIAYKAVQRTAKALAIGPVLQGLNKPVNDLSRGALVEDIVNTVLITAIQAGTAQR